MIKKLSLSLLLGLLFLFSMPSIAKAELKVGDPAPVFSSVDDLGQMIELGQFKGKTVVLYFYPKDNTPGCTAEAQSFRDHYSEFQNKNAVILGVSFDGEASHRKFKAQENLPFALLTKNQRQIAEAYGVGGIIFADRDTIIIGPDGLIKTIMRSVKAADHARVVLDALE